MRPLLLTLLLLITGLLAIVATPAGLHGTVWLTKRILPGELHVSGLEGRLLDRLAVRQLRYRQEDLQFGVDDFTFVWRPLALARGVLDVEIIDIDSAHFVQPAAAEDEATEYDWSLPLAIRIGQLNIGRFDYRGGNTDQILHNISASARTLEQTLHIESLSATGQNFSVSLAGRLQLRDPWRHEFEADFELDLPNQPRLSGRTRAGGDVHRSRIKLTLVQPSPAELRIELSDPLQTPVWTATLQSEAFDLEPWLASATSAGIDLQASGNGRQLQADLNLNVSGDIEQRVSAQTRAEFIDDRSIRIEKLTLKSPAQSLEFTGNGRLDWTDPPAIDLRGAWSIQTPRPAVGQVALSGDLEDYDLEFTATTEQPLPSDWRLAATGDARGLDIRQLSGRLLEGAMEGNGRIDWQQALRVTFDGRWQDIALPLGKDRLRSRRGRFSLHGDPGDYTLKSTGELQHPAWPAADWQLQAKGDRNGLAIQTLLLSLLDGRLQADGEMAWVESPRLDLTITLAAVNPGAQWPDWPGQLNGRTRAMARQSDGDWRLQLHGLELNGRLRGYSLSARGGFTATPGHYAFEQLRVAIAQSVLQANGLLAEDSDLDWRLESPDLSQLLPDTTGHMKASGHIRGRWEKPRLQARLEAGAVDTPWLAVDRLAARVDILAADDRFDFHLNAGYLKYGDRALERVETQIAGRLSRHTLRLAIQADKQRILVLQGQGQWTEPTWSLNFSEGEYRDPMIGDWQLEPGLRLALRRDGVEVSQHCWRQQPALLCLGGDWQAAGKWAAQLALEDYRIDENTPLPIGVSPARGRAALSLEATGHSDQLQAIAGDLRLEDILLKPEPSTELTIPALTSRLTGDAGGLNLTLDGRFGEPAPGSLSGKLHTGALTLDRAALLETDLDGEIRAHIDNLNPWLALYPRFAARQAQLDLDYAISGRIGSPVLRGDLALTATGVGIPELGIELDEFALQLAGEPRTGLQLKGHAVSGPGRLNLAGRVGLAKGALQLPGLNITGERFELINLPEAWILASPDLKLQYSNQLLAVNGKVLVPEAQLRPLADSGAIPVSDDERIIENGQAAEELPDDFDIRADIQLQLGDNVRITAGRGFEGRLAGGLDIQQHPGRLATAQGVLRIVEAGLSAYGQELEVEQGLITFTGQPIDNPAINVRAIREVGSVTAGIRTTGTAREPVTELFSTPIMAEADILSYLLVGRPMSGVKSGEGNLLLSAATTMGIRGTESLRQTIADTFGLDTLAVEAGGDQTDTSVVIGKYLAPNLYISYGAGLVETAVNTVRLRYEINRHLSLEAEQGKGTGVDLLYQIERKRK